MIKLVAIDIDGTLVNEEKIMTRKVNKAVHEAIDQGIKVVLCTGRPIEGIHPYLDQLDFKDENDYVISQNGACITQTSTMEIINERSLRLDEVQELLKFTRDFPVTVCALNEEHFFVVSDQIPEKMKEESRIVNMEIEIVSEEFFDEESRILKVCCLSSKEKLDNFEKYITSEMREKYYIVRSQSYFIEIMVKDTNKGTALEKLAEHLNLRMDEVMAIGDGENDYEMIEAAGLGVVMENGTKRLKGIANEMTLSNEEDGVAHAFEKWVLNQ